MRLDLSCLDNTASASAREIQTLDGCVRVRCPTAFFAFILSRLLSSCALASSAPLSNVAATSASFALPPVNDVRSRLEAANSS